MAVVINVMCIFKDVCGDQLTAVQGANTSLWPHLLSAQCIKKTDSLLSEISSQSCRISKTICLNVGHSPSSALGCE